MGTAGSGLVRHLPRLQAQVPQEAPAGLGVTRRPEGGPRLGQIGGIARGVVFATIGVFLVIAGKDASPKQAKGIDSALRALAHTPLAPVLLVIVALGLATFSIYSRREARWRVG